MTQARRAGLPGCPSSFALQQFALCPDEAPEGTASHVAMCSYCQELTITWRGEGDRYMGSLAADGVRALIASHQGEAPVRPMQRGRVAWAWGGALAAAASLLFFFSTSGPSPQDVEPSAPDVLTPKGTAELTLWIEDEQGEAKRLPEAAVLKPGARVQAMFTAPGPGFVALLIASPSEEQTQLYPVDGDQSAHVAAGSGTPIGPSFRVDEETGRYRITAYFSEEGYSTRSLLTEEGAHKTLPFTGQILTHNFEVQP